MHNPVAGPMRGSSGVGASDERAEAEGSAVGTVWVVDDSEAIRVLAKCAFERAGWGVTAFEDLAGALDELDRGPAPEAVLLDIHLPDGNGLDHVKAFAASGAAVVVVSNVAGPDRVEVAFAAGAADVVPKPFDLRTMLARVEHAVRSARARSAAAPVLGAVPPSAGAGGAEAG